MAEPKSKEEYEVRSFQNTYVSGYGLSVKQHFACPFCGAKDWAEARILELVEEMSKPRRCSECGRSAVIEFSSPSPGATSFSILQTGGDDPPEWVPIRRKPTP